MPQQAGKSSRGNPLDWRPSLRKSDHINRRNMENGHSPVKMIPQHLVIKGSDPMVVSKAGLEALSGFSEFVQDMIWDGACCVETKVRCMLGLEPQNTEMALIEAPATKKDRRSNRLTEEKQYKQQSRIKAQQPKAITGPIESVTQSGWSIINTAKKLTGLLYGKS